MPSAADQVGELLSRGYEPGFSVDIAPNGQDAMSAINGWTIDGATGSLYLSYSNPRVDGARLWLSTNPGALSLGDVQWELVHEFQQDREVMLLASGWSPQPDNLALYANIRLFQACDYVLGTCDQEGGWQLFRSADGGKQWEPLLLP